ncbi:MAG: hypothetical protein OXQ28_06855 [Acidobacteriota bacterium]|nr:hypothetical protein [Acidobacteriota bacterium]
MLGNGTLRDNARELVEISSAPPWAVCGVSSAGCIVVEVAAVAHGCSWGAE